MQSYTSTLLKIFLILFFLIPFTEAHAEHALKEQGKPTVSAQHKKHAASTRIKHALSVQHRKPAAKAQAKHVSSVRHKKSVVKKREKHISSVHYQKPVAIQQEHDITPVYAMQHNELETNIENFLNGLREKGQLSRDEMTGWMAYDITQDRILVNINADQAFQAASMIKPFIALAFFHQVQQGKLRYTPESQRKMEAMIQRSSNDAANWLMRKAGGPSQCEALLRTSYGSIFKRTQIKEYIPAGGRTYKNTALPSDYIRFLLALWKQKLPYDSEMQRLMALPGRDRLYDGTPLPNGTRVYNKTGTTAHLCGDMGILVLPSRNGQPYPYALVGIIERRSKASDYGTWMATRGNIIRHISTMIYEDMKRQHKLL
jgi:beta-lactamase class A